jgi:ATP-dependent Clp protease protease subunit
MKMIKKLLDKITAAVDEEQKVVLVDAAALTGATPEPDLRIVGMFCDVQEEKVAEVIHAMLYLNEINRVQKKPEDKKPIEFYLSTYGGSADDMFALYDVMRTIRQETEIHTLGLGKVMSAGVLLLAGGTKGKRRIAKNCRVMIHSVAAGNHGNLQDLKNELGAISDLQKMYTNCLVAETNMTKSDIKEMLDRNVNVYLSAEEAVKLGIADIIV